MSRYLDGSPKPADPIWYRQDETLHVRCRCGHQASGTIGRIALQAGRGGQERLWRLVERLQCARCGARDPAVRVGHD